MTSILSKKKRLKMAMELMPADRENYYDLFCDHGLLGEGLRRAGHHNVFFNDKKSTLIEEVKKNFNIPSEFLLNCSAQDISLRKNSGVFLLGVGGILMTEVVKSWYDSGLVSSDQYFLFGPHYYELKLRGLLKELNFEFLKHEFIWERGQGHEFFLAKWNPQSNKSRLEKMWGSFQEDFWQEKLEEDKNTLSYLLQKYKSYKMARHLEDFETSYSVEMGTFLAQLGT